MNDTFLVLCNIGILWVFYLMWFAQNFSIIFRAWSILCKRKTCTAPLVMECCKSGYLVLGLIILVTVTLKELHVLFKEVMVNQVEMYMFLQILWQNMCEAPPVMSSPG